MNNKKLKDIVNPFDWSRPITRIEEFAGRSEELDLISKMFDGVCDGKCFNFAIFGERASGKSSLLNIIGQKAREKGAIAIKVDLNENLVRSEADLIVEMMDKIIDAGTSRELLDKEYFESWRRNVDYYQIADSPSKELLRIGGIYANAKKNGLVPSIRPGIVESDFSVLSDLAGRKKVPFVIVALDEGDLLALNKGLLQMLRNLMQINTKIIFAVAGTQLMLSAIEEVFSPVPRQFSKIYVNNFKSFAETIDCFFKPLEAQGVKRSHIREKIGLFTLYSLHQRTNGNPYHIRLLSHFMFEEYKENESEDGRIELNNRVLGKVYKNISDDLIANRRKIKDALSSCSQEQLKAIAFLMQYQGLTLRDAATTLVAFKKPTEEILAQGVGVLTKAYSRIDSVSVLRLAPQTDAGLQEIVDAPSRWAEHRLVFAGDSLDRLYTEYFVTSTLSTKYVPFIEFSCVEDALFMKLFERLYREYAGFVKRFAGDQQIPYFVLKLGVMSTAEQKELAEVSFLKIFEEIVSYLADEKTFAKAYERAKEVGIADAIEHISVGDACHVLHVSGKIKNQTFYIRYYQPIESRDEKVEPFELPLRDRNIQEWQPTELSVCTKIAIEDEALESHGIVITNVQSVVLNAEAIRKLSQLAIKRRTEELYSKIQERNYDDALLDAYAIFRIWPGTGELNNVGFVQMLNGEYDVAHEIFKDIFAKVPQYVTSLFNDGYVEYRLGNMPVAEERFRQVIKITEKMPKEERRHSYLKIPLFGHSLDEQTSHDSDLMKDPDILVCAYCALSVILSLLEKKPNAEAFLRKARALEQQKTLVNRAEAWTMFHSQQIDVARDMLLKIKDTAELSVHGFAKSAVEEDLRLLGLAGISVQATT